MSYSGLKESVDPRSPHLGGNIEYGDPFTFSPTVWKYLIERFSPKTVLDVGSGQGHAAAWFARRGCHAVAIDGLRRNIDSAIFPTVQFDLTEAPVYCPVDLVHCQEVVEHIREKYLENLLATLCNGKIIMITHAKPGQGGHHHVNCQDSSYWIGKLVNKGFALGEEDTARIRKFAELDGARYVKETGLLFIRAAA